MGIGEPPQPAATSQSSDGGSSLAEGSGGDWTAVAATVANSVVAIQVAGSDAGGGSQGSGVVWDDAGHIVTNHHVVENAPEGRVSVLVDNQVFAGTVIGSDAPTDLAVVVLDNQPASLVPLARGDADALRVGDEVAAIGNPLGLSGSVTTGIVSALDRPIATGSGANQAAAITNAIQTSAALNPGNSGGALVNRAGELVGINSAIATLNGSQSGNIGIGFAIPVDLTNHIVTQLIETGDVAHALLGTTNGDGTAILNGVETLGAQVRTVEPGGPAEQAGIQVGDVIIEADGETISSSRDLVGTVRGFSVGQEVVFKVIRDGTVHEITVTMGQSPNL
ncbi:PDZ domain-containing protein [Gulosibacter macacae]|uniref:PDZ domain-containing protein n=2 Tax=Gulosibacter macacae TaxID=2488791 RepID=A0A3P3VVH0_9MICO|nr:PDZ domain-containing protein [Gulosibacter macacae]